MFKYLQVKGLNHKNEMAFMKTSNWFTEHKFTSGEWHIVIRPNIVEYLQEHDHHHVRIGYRLTSWDDIGHLLTLVNALRGCNPDIKIDLHIPYFPGGRQDRVANNGEPLTAKVYADVINNANFHEVYVNDPHSDVTEALLNNCTRIVHKKRLQNISKSYDAIVVPDAGALKKIVGYDLQKPLIQCLKSRDTQTGRLSGFRVCDDTEGLRVLIVDDICQRGGTFLGLYEKLKEEGAKSVALYVTHGFFDDGLAPFKDFSHIYTTNSVRDDLSGDNLVTIDSWGDY